MTRHNRATERTGIPFRIRRKAFHIRARLTHLRGLFALHTRDKINIKRIDPQNIGDSVCSPLDYYEGLDGFSMVDIKSILDPGLLDGKTIILGGGGLIELKWCEAELANILRARPKRLICWGAGFNQHGNTRVIPPSYVDKFDLFGIRDYGFPYEWVPCPSCRSPLFDRHYEIRHDVVLYLHHAVAVDREQFKGIPFLLNSERNLQKVLSFLGSGETVVTSTYHGAYWSVLLGRRVVIVNPFSQKFHYFKHQPPITDVHSWKDAAKSSRTFPEALSEAREANLRFHEKVVNEIA